MGSIRLINGSIRGRTGRRLAGGLAALILAGTMGMSQAGTAAAATTGPVGGYAAAAVSCNYRTHVMSVMAAASPVAGLASQTVYYQYFVWDITAQAYVATLNPTQFGTIAAWSRSTNFYGQTVYNNGLTASAYGNFNMTPGHIYSVRVDYWWQTNGIWGNRLNIWTVGAQEFGYSWEPGNGTVSTDGCHT